ncbi:hypothetical protein [Streptomyces sp. NPDC058718]|uniref:hypothetical protein n=1 Tax=Streptomyces sp. NPDC058718 TaxID=3346610 RepID=UPI0036930695
MSSSACTSCAITGTRLPPAEASSSIARRQRTEPVLGVQSEGSRHGPYWLRLVAPDVYEAVSRERSAYVLWGWVNQLGDVPAELEADLQQEVFDRLAVADHIYYLSGLGDEAIHDWGRVHEHFHEFVLIDRSAGRITLLVAADD